MQDTGRIGFREAGEPPDERPVLVREQFWADQSEQMTYEHAVQANPQRPDEGNLSYLARIAASVEGKYLAAGGTMPSRLSPVAYRRRLDALERQRKGLST